MAIPHEGTRLSSRSNGCSVSFSFISSSFPSLHALCFQKSATLPSFVWFYDVAAELNCKYEM